MDSLRISVGAALLVALLLLGCGGPKVTTLGGGDRTWVANLELAAEKLQLCAYGQGLRTGSNCIQRVKLTSGVQQLELSPVACPSGSEKLVDADSVRIRLVIETPQSGQEAQLFDRRTGAVVASNRSIGALTLDGTMLKELCSGDYFERCTPVVSNGGWSNVTAVTDPPTCE